MTAPVHQFVESFNNGDVSTNAAGCANVTSLIDDFPPHEWYGAGACSRWMRDYNADAKKSGLSAMVITLGTPRHIDITADRAYVVVPVYYTNKRHGKEAKKTGQ